MTCCGNGAVLSISRMARLKLYKRSTSCCRSTASRARALAFADSRLAIREVARKLNRATQFCGSAIVKVPTGGKKKKLKTRVARIDDTAASKNPQVLAMLKTSSKYANPTVVALTGITLCATNVTTATPPNDAKNRNGRRASSLFFLRLDIVGQHREDVAVPWLS